MTVTEIESRYDLFEESPRFFYTQARLFHQIVE